MADIFNDRLQSLSNAIDELVQALAERERLSRQVLSAGGGRNWGSPGSSLLIAAAVCPNRADSSSDRGTEPSGCSRFNVWIESF